MAATNQVKVGSLKKSEARVNFAREDGLRRMRVNGYRVVGQGVAMRGPKKPVSTARTAPFDDWR